MIGATVLYKLSADDVKIIDLRSPQHVPTTADGTTRNHVSPGDVYPAVVVRDFDHDRYYNLRVLLDGYADYWATSRSEGDEHGQWTRLP